MPSWNIHIAHAEHLFAREGAVARTVLDRNAFLLGSLTPDIPVGYMVPGVEHPIAYRITHFAKPAFIPKPREQEFWDAYVVPAAAALAAEGLAGTPATECRPVIAASSLKLEADRVSRIHYPQRYEGVPEPVREGSPLDEAVAPADIARSLLDFELGVWVHLLADCLWNTRVNEFLDREGIAPSEQFRIKKQGDFDAFGKTLAIDSVPRSTPRLVATAAAFPQYAIDERTLLMTIGVAHEVVRTNAPAPVRQPYRLLTDEFFDSVFAEVVDRADALLAERLG
ncbi:hypothetical protein [[Collinsella] massiliensis]|uniref:Phospholipase C/D domain-containing protein n=1 Tax=[Collinsella] massiliensis TaxID=1232426 RepID=A0A1Y3XN76_9ACTN|nr:hypothetical protein [[Collinsella] massiliensis]OUN86994.1 hypothetical protein B5G02_08030 [[Collinsella] massiliensis]